MNRLEMPVPNPSWKAETQAIRPSAQGPDDGNGEQNPDALEGFDALLRKMSKGEEASKVRAPAVDLNSVPSSADGGDEEAIEQNSLDDLLGVTGRDADALSAPVPGPAAHPADSASSAQPFSPQLLAATPSAQPALAARDEASSSSSSSLLDLIKLSSDAAGEGSIGEGPSAFPERKAVVIHQETHFKPVLVTQDPAKPKTNGAFVPSPVSAAGPGEGVTAPAGTGEGGVQLSDPTPQVARNPVHPATGAHVIEDPDASPDPHAIFQQLAGAINDDARQVPLAEATPLRQHDTSMSEIKTKQANGVLRVLDIQLRPLELGVVTVRMRLSGDRIEMELHASREETAELLRKDSEMLSGLLRSSGYRPDLVTVHIGRPEGAQPDGMFGQRHSANPDGAAQFGSSHGGETGRNGGSQDDTDGFRDGTRKEQKNGVEEVPAANRSHGNLYL